MQIKNIFFICIFNKFIYIYYFSVNIKGSYALSRVLIKACHPKTVTVGEMEIDMSMVHYEGKLGIFDYDDTEFEVTHTERTFDDTIRYIGDSAEPKIPEGIKRCNRMFSGCTSLVNAPVIPESVKKCDGMFSGCTSLVNAPIELPRLWTCHRMFSGCTSLVNAPKLKAIRNCNHMFSGCVSLRIAPEIPPNSNDCRGMFEGCVNIENAPKIPKYACYADIFRGTKFYGTCVRK